jgi:hypothetical protein
MKYGNMISRDPECRVWQIQGTPPASVICPMCAMPMLRYENPERWLCFNIKMHDKP